MLTYNNPLFFKFGFVEQGFHPCTPPEPFLQKGFWTPKNLKNIYFKTLF